MATARHRDRRTDRPAGWMLLLGLMVLALVIAASAKGCSDSDANKDVAGGSTTTTGTSTSANAGQNVVDEIKQTIDRSGGIQFRTGSADLTSASESTLNEVAKIMSRNPNVNVVISGHTDTQGAAQANKELSQRRANAVRNYLVTQGISALRMTARGLGEEQPLVADDTNSEAARQQNRRVEFTLASG